MSVHRDSEPRLFGYTSSSRDRGETTLHLYPSAMYDHGQQLVLRTMTHPDAHPSTRLSPSYVDIAVPHGAGYGPGVVIRVSDPAALDALADVAHRAADLLRAERATDSDASAAVPLPSQLGNGRRGLASVRLPYDAPTVNDEAPGLRG